MSHAHRPERPPADFGHGIPAIIVCVECGGPCHLLTRYAEDARPEAGDIVAYRCAHCLDRWDVELAAEDVAGDP